LQKGDSGEERVVFEMGGFAGDWLADMVEISISRVGLVGSWAWEVFVSADNASIFSATRLANKSLRTLSIGGK